MAIADTINSIKTNLSNAYTKAQEKGATIPTNKNIANLEDTIDSIQTGGTTPYEYADIDPFNVVKILDEDTDTITSKQIVLLGNYGTNTYTLNNVSWYIGCTKIKTSDGQEMNYTSGMTLTFDPTKDVVNSNGTPTRYMILYYSNGEARVKGTDNVPVWNTVLMQYFKNLTIKNTDGYFEPDVSCPILEFICDDNTVLTTSASALLNQTRFYGCNLRSIKLKNFSGISNFSEVFDTCRNLKNIDISFPSTTTTIAKFMTQNVEHCILRDLPNTPIQTGNGGNSVFGYTAYALNELVCYPKLIIASGHQINLYYSRGLERLEGIDFDGMTNSLDASYCSSLQHISRIYNIGMSFNLKNSYYLTRESLLNLLNALKDLTGGTSQTLSIGSNNLSKLTETEKAIATNKNWTLS